MTIVSRTRFITVAAASVALLGSLAPAQAAPAPASRAGANVQGQNQSAEQPRRICATMEFTGTRVTRRVCRTAAEWDRVGGVPGRD